MGRATTRMSIIGAVLASGLAGCDGAVMGSQAATETGTTSGCVELPDGTYQFANGMFIPEPGIPADWGQEDTTSPADPVRQWSDRLQDNLRADGYEWLATRMRGEMAFLEGEAPDAEAKAAALSAARADVSGEDQATGPTRLLIDNISIDGAPAPVGAPVASLPSSPSMAACETAFASVLDGRTLEFSANNEEIGEDSIGTADALSGVAVLCDTHQIEIGGHTDARGAESFNQRLSQTRANTIRDYFTERGVSAGALSAIGYGESQPIDTSQTTEAYARNRRVEFTLSARTQSADD